VSSDRRRIEKTFPERARPRTHRDQARRLPEEENIDIFHFHKLYIRPCFIEEFAGIKACTICKFLERYEPSRQLSPRTGRPPSNRDTAAIAGLVADDPFLTLRDQQSKPEGLPLSATEGKTFPERGLTIRGIARRMETHSK
jgi:hypothetical protein